MLASVRRLSTSAATCGARLAYWNEAWASTAGPLVVEADEESFQGVLTNLRAGQFEVVSVSSAPATVRRSATPGTSRPHAFLLQVVHSGACLLRHNGFKTELRTGDLVVADLSKPYELSFVEPVHGLSAPLPVERFGALTAALEIIAGRRIDATAGAAALLSSFLRSTWDLLADGDAQGWPLSAEQLVWELLQAVLRGDSGSQIGPGRANRLRHEAKTHIEARLSDPEFDSAKLAGEMGVSARYMQMVFAQVGISPSRFLLGRRLEAAAARLRRLDLPYSITAVALECGFNDLSYFSRSFRRRFGASPSSYRRGLAAAPVDWR